MKIFENIEKHNDKQRIIVLSNFIKKAEEQEEKIDEKESIKIPLDESNKSEKTEDDKATPEQVEKLKSFIKKNNYLDDEAFHIYAIEIGLNPHEAEEAIYQILHDSFSEEGINKILDGKSKNLTPEEIASEHGMTMGQLQRQINLGLKVEREHTKNEDAALAITLDHLVEDGRYYTNKKPKDWAEKEIKKEDKQLEEVKTEEEGGEKVKKAIIAEKGELMEKAYAEGTRVNFKDGWYVKTDGKWKKEQKKEKIVILKKYDEYFPISNVLLGQKVIYKGTSYWVQDGSDVHILLSKKKRKEEKTEKDFIKINQNQFNKDAQLTSEFDNDIQKPESTPEEYTNNLSKAIQFDIKGNIKLNKEQNEKLNKLSEPEIEKFFTVLTGISKPETISAFKKLNKTAKIDALTYFIAKQGKNRKEDVKNIFKPHEGELRHFTDGDYIYTSGHWKKIKI